MFGNEIIKHELPLKYVFHTPCFRDEKSSAGRDTRGIKRVHQFEKVELYGYEHPSNSINAFNEMVSEVSKLCEALNFTYRVVDFAQEILDFSC